MSGLQTALLSGDVGILQKDIENQIRELKGKIKSYSYDPLSTTPANLIENLKVVENKINDL